jgi:hypothetical protein
LLFGLISLAGCARQAPPPGGPVDETGPVILASYPHSESVGVAKDVRPWLKLNEYLLASSIDGSVFISPEPPGGYSVKTSGKRVKIRFTEALPSDRTIVITFGSGIRDVNGNQMSESFVLAFSTGSTIDRAAIMGRIKDVEKPADTWIWAYPLETESDPDPRFNRAPYAVQPDIGNQFNLSFLPPGRYRLFAVEEVTRNRLWDADREGLAISSTDVLAHEHTPPVVTFVMNNYDLNPPTLRGVQALHRQGIRLSFSEAVDISEAQVAVESETGVALTVMDLYQDRADSSAALLSTGPQREGDIYSILLTGLKDLAGNLSDSLAAEFEASTAEDSLGPRFSWSSPVHGARNVPLDSGILVGFSEAVTLMDLPRSIKLVDPDSNLVSGSWNYPGSSWGRFIPDEPLRSVAEYTVQIIPDSLRDIFANRSSDSLIIRTFTTLDLEDLGSITGRVEDAEANLRIVAEPLEGTLVFRETAVLENGDYRFGDLPASYYRLFLYQDLDGNQRYSSGQLEPFTFSEPYKVIDDTIRVRPRWVTEEVNFSWKTLPFPADSSAGSGE